MFNGFNNLKMQTKLIVAFLAVILVGGVALLLNQELAEKAFLLSGEAVYIENHREPARVGHHGNGWAT
jgi:hypothetical protein